MTSLFPLCGSLQRVPQKSSLHGQLCPRECNYLAARIQSVCHKYSKNFTTLQMHLQGKMKDKIPKLLNHICLEIPMHLNFPTFPFEQCPCCGLLKELMIWASLSDGQSQTRTPPTFAIVLWYREWCNILICSLFSITVKFSHHIQPRALSAQMCCHAIYKCCCLTIPKLLAHQLSEYYATY